MVINRCYPEKLILQFPKSAISILLFIFGNNLGEIRIISEAFLPLVMIGGGELYVPTIFYLCFY